MMELPPVQLFAFLRDNFAPSDIDEIASVEDMQHASKELLRLSSAYSYLNELSAYSKICVREARRNLSRTQFEDMCDRKAVVEDFTKSIQQQYAAVSRAVTIYIESMKELKMMP